MDRTERIPDGAETLRAVQRDLQRRIRTSMPGIIQSVDLRTADNPTGKNTCAVQPAIQGRVQAQNGEWGIQNLPILEDVPLFFYGGGGCSLTFDVQRGDECELRFSDRGLDYFWQHGGIQPPAEWRMHHLADAIAVVGQISQADVVVAVGAGACLQTDDGTGYIQLVPGAEGADVATVKAGGGINLIGAVTATGLFTLNGNFSSTGTMSNNGVNVGSTHKHLDDGEGELSGVPQ